MLKDFGFIACGAVALLIVYVLVLLLAEEFYGGPHSHVSR